MADTILGAATFGDEINAYAIQNWAPYRMVITGDFGVACLDSSALNVLWNFPANTFNGATEVKRTDIDNQGNVVIKAGGKFYVIDADGTIKNPSGCDACDPGDEYHFGGCGVRDVSIQNDTVYIAGTSSKTISGLNPPGTCSTPGEAGFPIFVPWIRAFAYNGSDNYEFAFRTFGFKGEWCQKDQSDFYGGLVNEGRDGKMYAGYGIHGGNNMGRWDGKSLLCDWKPESPKRTLIEWDFYNMAVNQAVPPPHPAYYCALKPGEARFNRKKSKYLPTQIRHEYQFLSMISIRMPKGLPILLVAVPHSHRDDKFNISMVIKSENIPTPKRTYLSYILNILAEYFGEHFLTLRDMGQCDQ